MRIACAAAVYALAVFAVGFVLGVIRTLWVVPQVGALVAVAIELPVILLASWVVARRVVRFFAIATFGSALAVGILALSLLLLFECGLVLVTGGTAADWLESLSTPSGLLGLGGQGVFAIMPFLAVTTIRRA